MAAAAVSLACPLRRSSRLAHAHNHTHSPPPLRQSHQSYQLKQHHHQRHHTRAAPDPEPDPDSSSSDPENELTPRALRALKRQRLALDVDGLPLAARVRPRKRRKENIIQVGVDDTRLSQLPRKDAAEVSGQSGLGNDATQAHTLTQRTKRPSSPTLTPLALKRAHSTDNQRSAATGDNVAQIPTVRSISIPDLTTDPPNEAGPPSISISVSTTPDERPSSATFRELSLAAAFNDEPSILSPRDNSPRSSSIQGPNDPYPVLSITLSPTSAEPITTPPPSPPGHTSSRASSPEPLTPLTPLTPTPESSPSFPGHDRQITPPPSPPHDPLPPPFSLEVAPTSSSPAPDTPATPNTIHQPATLDPALDTLIPFEGLPPQFDPDLSLHLDRPPTTHPQNLQQLQGVGIEQEQFPSLQQPQLYVPPPPAPGRDREINIWKLACQERVDYLLRRYGSDYIKQLVALEARCLIPEARSSWPSPFSNSAWASSSADSDFNAALAHTPSPTRFRLYTPASYTYTSNSWGSGSGAVVGGKGWPGDGDSEDPEADWGMDDGEWGDGDVDMEDEDEDDYEDDEDFGEADADGEGDVNVGAVEGLKIGDVGMPSVLDHNLKDEVKADDKMEVDASDEKTTAEQMDEKENITQVMDEKPSSGPIATQEVPQPSSSPSPPPVSSPDSSPPPPSTPAKNTYLPPAQFTPPARHNLPPLSSLHVPLLSEPPRAFMGRGTPPDRRRLVEWSGSSRFAVSELGMGPPLYLSPVPQRHVTDDVGVDVGIVPMTVDTQSSHQPQHQHQGGWTSFLYAMLEGDGVNVGVNVGNAGQSSEAGWYELGLESVPVPGSDLGMPLSHSPPSLTEHAVEEGSSSTLRFALG
ncbi:hypothetical protein HYDPIDRAFT_168878 [Hydnomerulius pinastri MD-312]|uniref:Uncharacterized protein n=1 Tax=Hydnomerulius pinastri MD-312 TaxID=994086 RepID=A0A0C9W740_9AGAM|nr:hypothetical protein HYDPIDRAFT_168878 [Hydnomerulius pinastri MD-312]